MVQPILGIPSILYFIWKKNNVRTFPDYYLNLVHMGCVHNHCYTPNPHMKVWKMFVLFKCFFAGSMLVFRGAMVYPTLTSWHGQSTYPHVRYPMTNKRDINHSCSLYKALLRLYFSWGTLHRGRLTGHEKTHLFTLSNNEPECNWSLFHVQILRWKVMLPRYSNVWYIYLHVPYRN